MTVLNSGKATLTVPRTVVVVVEDVMEVEEAVVIAILVCVLVFGNSFEAL